MIVWPKVYSDMATWSMEVLLSSFWDVLRPGPQKRKHTVGRTLAIFTLDPLDGRGTTNWSGMMAFKILHPHSDLAVL